MRRRSVVMLAAAAAMTFSTLVSAPAQAQDGHGEDPLPVECLPAAGQPMLAPPPHIPTCIPGGPEAAGAPQGGARLDRWRAAGAGAGAALGDAIGRSVLGHLLPPAALGRLAYGVDAVLTPDGILVRVSGSEQPRIVAAGVASADEGWPWWVSALWLLFRLALVILIPAAIVCCFILYDRLRGRRWPRDIHPGSA